MEWQQYTARLLAGEHTATGDPLDAGAEIVVTNPDGRETYRAALARHCRVDEYEPNLLWIRPIPASVPAPSTGTSVFNLSICRRRSLSWDGVRVENEHVVFTLRSGQTAHIGPAAGETLVVLQEWDTFTLTLLTAEEERALERLEEDSWQGRFG